MIHSLKIWPVYFEAVKDGSKTFEYRNNKDRGFQKGDIVELNEYDPSLAVECHRWIGNKLIFKIGYVLPVSESDVVFSLLPLDSAQNDGGTK